MPRSITRSFYLWMGAILAAVVELGVSLAIMPGDAIAAVEERLAEISVRVMAYAVLLALALAMRGGSNLARHFLALAFGLFGTISLVIEPGSWLLRGGDVYAFLAEADGPMWVMILSRIAHIICVVAGTALMYRPADRSYFRRN
jgi:hypothetical protein